MTSPIKNVEAILQKLNIDALNSMQMEAHESILSEDEVILLSPTGTGKTLAFLLPILELINPETQGIQVLILVPSRELAIQIEQVFRSMGTGLKANAVYGGRSGYKDKIDLKHPPTVLIGTPGRVSDHLKRSVIDVSDTSILVLDEFDKSLEVGFEGEMSTIVRKLPSAKKKILTSATQKVEVPDFVGLRTPKTLKHLEGDRPNIRLYSVSSAHKDKRSALIKLLKHLGNQNGIVFCNFKDTIQFVSEALLDERIPHECFFGGLEQIDRERALIKFRNGTTKTLIATDLAARGLDVPEMDFIIHYQMPLSEEEFIHRNGRTARMKSEGAAYLLHWEKENLPEYVSSVQSFTPNEVHETQNDWVTLYISGGRKDKISKGDIAGLFFKQGELERDELGFIELKQDCSYVSVPKKKHSVLVSKLNNTRLKKKKVRISLVE